MLMRDFPGPWDYSEVVKKSEKSPAGEHLSFVKLPCHEVSNQHPLFDVYIALGLFHDYVILQSFN